MMNFHEPERLSQENSQPSPLLPLLFFPIALLYHELLLKAFDRSSPFFSVSLLYILLFSAAAGLVVSLLLSLLPWRKGTHGAAYVLCALWTVFTCVEYCCKSYFKTYFSLSFATGMAGQVMGDFFGTMVEIVLARLPFIFLSMLPLAALIVFRRRLLPSGGQSRRCTAALIGIAVVCQLAGSLLCGFGRDKAAYTYDFTTDRAVPKFGLLATLRVEMQHSIFGTPDAPIVDLGDIDIDATDHPNVVQYDYNLLDIDFDALAQNSSGTLSSLHRQISALAASRQSQYTGLFRGKNLIEITAEAFCPYVISEELTPTLYKLTHEGFVFTDYYQPGWGQSTTGGEFAVMTGLIPTWVGDNLSFYVSHRDSMPFALGNQLRGLGYNTVAYHNNSYTYYNRDLTHPNLGYDYYGVGNGLKMTGGSAWPYSDLEMFQLTVPSLLENSASTGAPFHAYYMTVSGHANWGWGNAMSAKHRAEAVAAYPDASQPVQGYIAANLELEAALTYLLEQLEDAGIADDTVICLTADHYPYALVTEDADYYQELSGIADSEADISRYRNTLLLWSGSMEHPVEVDTPCSAIDILPTLSNLFGLSFDSRLLSGHDIFAENYTVSQASTSMPLVILPTAAGNSWITAAGTYDAKTDTFTPNPGVTVNGTYVTVVNSLIAARYSYAKAIIQYNYYGVALEGVSPAVVTTVPDTPDTPDTDIPDDTAVQDDPLPEETWQEDITPGEYPAIEG